MKIKRLLAFATACLFSMSLLTGCAKESGSSDSGTSSELNVPEFDFDDTPTIDYVSDVNDSIDTTMTAIEFVKGIKVGWNLGNTLDATGNSGLYTETSWGNPAATEELFLAVKEAGFNAVRIPTTWEKHMDDEYNIDGDWMKRVTQVVDYAYKNDMYVILNMHHESWNYPYEDNKAAAAEIMTKAWTQIAENFSGYGERLIFEGMNEPRWVGTDWEWSGGNEEGRSVVNYLGQVFVDAVRATGGNNAQRFLMVPDYAANSGESALADWVCPNDPANRVILSVHAYTPYSFALQEKGSGKWLAERPNCTREIDALAEVLDRLFLSKGIAVIIGETGAMNRYITDDEGNSVTNENYRAEWSEYFTSTFHKLGIPCFFWDNAAFVSGETFGIFDRRTYECKYPDYVAGAVKGAESE